MKQTLGPTIDHYEGVVLSLTHYRKEGYKFINITRRGLMGGNVCIDVEEIAELISALQKCRNEQDKYDEANSSNP